MKIPGMYSAHEAADYLEMAVRTVYDYAERGVMPSHLIGGRRGFVKEELDCWKASMEERKNMPYKERWARGIRSTGDIEQPYTGVRRSYAGRN